MLNPFIIKKQNRNLLIFALISFLFIALSIYALSKALTPNTYSIGTPAAKFIANQTPQEKAKAFEKWRKEDVLKFSSAEEASKKAGFKVKLPKRLLGKERLIGTFVTKDEIPSEREVYIVFKDPVNPILLILRNRATIPIDYEKEYNQMLEDKRKGYAKNDAEPKLIEINGVKALAINEGYNFIGRKKVPRPAVVDFTKDGVQYQIYGQYGPQTTPLEELIKIAASIE